MFGASSSKQRQPPASLFTSTAYTHGCSWLAHSEISKSTE
jgi:hypothetical protein